MGKLSHDLHLQHFSHPHFLELTNSQTLNISPCSGCKLQSSGWMYTCRPCNFTLHTSCSQLPQLITHPAHPHSLSLLPTPAYPVGCFNCDACGQQGHGFNYHCNLCDFDIHSVCASKPLSLRHQSHPCPLQLFFYPPYQTKGFSCDICHQIGSNHWLYRCSLCEFDVHLSCASMATYTSTNRQPNIQFHPWNSFPGAAQNNFQHSSGPVQMNNQCYTQPQSQNNGTAVSGNALMDATAQGLVEGAAQQVGQNFVQSLTGDGSNNGGNAGSGGNGSNSSSSIVDIGSALLSGMFGSDS